MKNGPIAGAGVGRNYRVSQHSHPTSRTPSAQTTLNQLISELRIARRMLVDEMALSMDPEKVVPDIGHMRILAGVQTAIAAVEAVIAEDTSKPDGELR